MYFLVSILFIYNLYKLMMLFFDNTRINRKKEIVSYVIYFFVNVFISTYFPMPILLVTSSIIGFTLISLNYKASLKKRILAICFIVLLSACVETVTVQLISGLKLQLFRRDQPEFNYMFSLVQLILYSVTIILGKFKNIKKGEQVSPLYWFFITFIPLISLYIILLLMYIKDIPVFLANMAIIGIMVVNVLTFYLYDRVSVMHIERTEKLLLEQQNKYYDEQFKSMNSSIKATRAIRHDLNNHIAIVSSLIEQGTSQEALQYLKDIKGSYNRNGNYVQTGNIAIDSVLNFKLQEADGQNVDVSFDISIPDTVEIPAFDIVTVLGNLLDNALDATCKLEDNRKIDLQMKYDKGRFLFKIENTYNGQVLKQDGIILTTKHNSSNHGIGLENVRKIVDKYEGMMDIEHDENKFSVTFLCYIND